MADYYGTDDDDLIDALQLPEDFNKASDKIYPGKGNDEIINIDGHEVVSSEGNDSYSGINIKLAFFFDPDAVTINLLDGIANDAVSKITLGKPSDLDNKICKSIFSK